MEERTSGFKPIKKKKGRFNPVDLLITLIVIALIAAVILVFDPFSLGLFDGDAKEVRLEYTIRIDNVEGALVEKIHNGDEVVDAAVKTSLGYVSSVENDIPHTEPYYNSDNDEVSMKEKMGLYWLNRFRIAEVPAGGSVRRAL